MLAAKLKMLKNLQRQMHCLMDEGHGDDEDAGADAVAKVADEAAEGEKLADKVADDSAEMESDDELAAERKSFFKRTGKIKPKAGALVVMVAGKPSAPPAGGKSLFASGMKPGKRHG